MVTREEVLNALRQVKDPELGRSLVELGMVRDIVISDGCVEVTIALTVSGCPLRHAIQSDAQAAIANLPGVKEAVVHMTSMNQKEREALFGTKAEKEEVNVLSGENPPQVIAVASGKGGVGKSTVTVNLALALAQQGVKVGLIDADIYGFSVPRMLGLNGRARVIGEKVVPFQVHGVEVISMGSFVDEDVPLIWRGPMLRGVLQQFLRDVLWSRLDYLLLDLPPGTGDVALDVAQLIPHSSLLLVTTPQKVSAGVASRAAHMAEKTAQRIIGVVENMSWLECPHCRERMYVLGHGGGQELALKLGVPLLAQIPLCPSVNEAADEGVPAVVQGNNPVAQAFLELAEVLRHAVPTFQEIQGV